MGSAFVPWPSPDPEPQDTGFPSSDLFGDAPENCEGCWTTEIIDLQYRKERTCIRWVPFLEAWLCGKCLHAWAAWEEARPRYASEETWNKFMPDAVRNLRIYRKTGEHPWQHSGPSEQ
jgi:hypothetical protein